MKRPTMRDDKLTWRKYAVHLESLLCQWIDWRDSIYDHDGEEPCVRGLRKGPCDCFMCESGEVEDRRSLISGPQIGNLEVPE